MKPQIIHEIWRSYEQVAVAVRPDDDLRWLVISLDGSTHMADELPDLTEGAGWIRQTDADGSKQ